jgi:cytoskeletal protein CcmA (bactofilin family)
MSPYQRMSEALSPTSPALTGAAAPAEARNEHRAEPAKSEPAKSDTVITEARTGSESAKSGGDSVSKLIVGPDIKLKGAEITDCDTLVVEGRVEAAMDSRVIQIADIGMFVGKAGVDTAEIRGHFEGELTARKQLIIRASGRVTGKIRYGKVTIEEGGELSGDVGSLTAAPTAMGAGASAQARH